MKVSSTLFFRLKRAIPELSKLTGSLSKDGHTIYELDLLETVEFTGAWLQDAAKLTQQSPKEVSLSTGPLCFEKKTIHSYDQTVKHSLECHLDLKQLALSDTIKKSLQVIAQEYYSPQHNTLSFSHHNTQEEYHAFVKNLINEAKNHPEVGKEAKTRKNLEFPKEWLK